MCMLVGLDEASLHSTHAVTRTHCQALAVTGDYARVLEYQACMHVGLAKASSVGACSALQVRDPEDEEERHACPKSGGACLLPSSPCPFREGESTLEPSPTSPLN